MALQLWTQAVVPLGSNKQCHRGSADWDLKKTQNDNNLNVR